MQLRAILYVVTLLLLSLSFSCGNQSEQSEPSSAPVSLPVSLSPSEIEPKDRSIEDWMKLTPASDGFDYPVGPPDAKGYYNAQKFGKNLHLGDDWNGTGGGNTDLGDPVFASAKGVVVYAEDHGPGWGNIVRVLHKVPGAGERGFIETLYAHLEEIKTQLGDTLNRGQRLGSIGNADGAYYAHLHFELRTKVGQPVGGGYDQNTEGFTDPTAFIKKHRPKE